MASWHRAFGFLVLMILFCLSPVRGVMDLTKNLAPKGPLGVRLDFDLATELVSRVERSHRWLFSTRIVFNEPVSALSNGQVAQMVKDGFMEMEREIRQYGVEATAGPELAVQPTSMTIMAFDHEIIMASTQKGSVSLINEARDSPVKAKLELCQAFWKDNIRGPVRPSKGPDYRNSRRCGEIMAFHLFYLKHGSGRDISELDPKARVTTIHKDESSNLVIINPCGPTSREANKWGCNYFWSLGNDGKELMVDYLHQGIAFKPYELFDEDGNEVEDLIAGGVKEIEQITTCMEPPPEEEDEDDKKDACEKRDHNRRGRLLRRDLSNLSMQRWKGTTYQGFVEVKVKTMEHCDLVEYAKEGYRQIKDKSNFNGIVVVSALFVPDIGVFVASKPRAARPWEEKEVADALLGKASEKFPAWEVAVEGREPHDWTKPEPPKPISLLHAEDKALIDGGAKYCEVMRVADAAKPKIRFPKGTKIATWGTYNGQDSRPDTFKPPCGDNVSSQFSPNCKDVLDKLKVEYDAS